MKILVLQLARLGDIYQTWPVLRALKRQNPTAELHLLTREKFALAAKSAAAGAKIVDRHWLMSSKDLLTPLIDERPDVEKSLEKLVSFTEELKGQQFDRIVNLTFSPFSSYLTREISTREDGTTCDVAGYTRFDDGYLSIPDDGSAYFYAQVGPGKPNRLHLTDLFAHVAGVELGEEDWGAPAVDEAAKASTVVQLAGEKPIVVHVGASDLKKTFSWSKWLQIVKGLLGANTGSKIVLVGSAEEAEWAAKITVSGDLQPVNLVGKTTLPELFEIVRKACVVVGGDSGPMQVASLLGTPVYGISFPIVSFWETGPRSKGSRILPVGSDEAVSSEEIVADVVALVQGRPSRLPIVRVPGPTYPYVETRPQPQAYEWELLRSLYLGEEFPPASTELFIVGMTRLHDVNRLALEQVATLRKNSSNKIAASILDRVDELMEQIVRMVPETGPVVRWFRTERIRIGPMPVESLVEATEIVHRRLGDIIALYSANQEGGSNDDVVLE